jgi:hypothetical protein
MALPAPTSTIVFMPDQSPPEVSLASVSAVLVDHLSNEVRLIRQLELDLDVEHVSEVRVRQVLGALFTASVNSLAIARGFHDSMRRLDADGSVTASALLGAPNIDAVMASWLEDTREAATLVTADLVSIEALAVMIEDSTDDEASATRSALELIRALATNAISRLDLAHSPAPTEA